MGVRVPPELMDFIENEVAEAGGTKADIVIEALWVRYNGVSQNVNDSDCSNGNASDDSVIDVYRLVFEEKDQRISFLEGEIHEKNSQIHKFQANQQLYLADRTGLIEKLARKLKLKK